MEATTFLSALKQQGYTHFSGVPCSFLKPLINAVINDLDIDYIGASSEGESIGISLGAHLAGKKTVSICQNSGLGNMVNPLTSLNNPFKVPTLLITTLRGEPGTPDEPQHTLMGEITGELLDTLRIPWQFFPDSEEAIAKTLSNAEDAISNDNAPYALVLKKGTLSPTKLEPSRRQASVQTYHLSHPPSHQDKRPSRTKAINTLLSQCSGNEAIIATTGKTGRELFTQNDRDGNLYVVGGMGTASAIGLGIATSLPNQAVIVLDGDGAALMKLGALATIGHYQPDNLLHIVLDNESHDSTGGQATSSSTVDFAQIASACNYRNVYRADSLDQLSDCLDDSRRRHGPSLIHLKIKPGSPPNLGRPNIPPHQVKERFMQFLQSNRSSS
ncbi:phosphonopyruvate decarboxylase [Verrucomicrobiaceae bacterium N1E253]|uniref:Phosphonopyruvate decarboxylase n=1 Tax=Oceaniferula marina TaxID=2748318 RepID=A0A851GAZ6_9BACT|nr:phosphonopyruvate decarboxylase [Oceaniferula marina]NWK54349.1 phosphonopyruvate decarboxylase [Oceaniferula marina]